MVKAAGDSTSNMVTNMGAASAGGAVGATMIKYTPLPPTQRIAAAVVAAGLTSGGVTVGIQAGGAIFKILNVSEVIENHTYGEPDIEREPSPDSNLINSALENGDQLIPLVGLLLNLVTLNLLELIVFITVILLVFNRYFIEIFKDFISKILNKYMPAKYHYLNKFLQKSNEYNTKFIKFLIAFLIVLLLLMILINLYICSELYTGIDDYVLVYNFIKKISKSSILLIIRDRNPCTTSTLLFNIKYKFNRYVLLNFSLLKFKFLYVINYLFYILNRVVTMLYARGQFAWVKLTTHQRLNVGHSSRAICAELSKISITKQTLNDNNELFYQWLVGITDAEGTFQIVSKNGKWSLVFKLFQYESNKRLLYFIKKRLGVGILIKSKTYHFYYKITDNKKIKNHIFPIFDKYPLLTTKYFDYSKFKEAYTILEDNNLTKLKQDELIFALVKKVPSKSYLSPAWKIVNNKVFDTNDAKKVISKAWLIGFTEAKGSFYLINSSKGKIVHGFKIIKILCPIVLYAIERILGIKTKFKKSSNTIETTNSRAIQNIIKYLNGSMKGMKSFEYRVWARSFVKHKGDFTKLQEIKSNLKH